MSRIGICHFRVGETDGVSLEIDKWRGALEALGHEVFLCAGRSGGEEAFLIPELSLDHPEVEKIRRNAFQAFSDYPSEGELHDHIEAVASRIERGLRHFVEVYDINLLIVENIWSLSPHLPATLALWRTVRGLRLPAIAHHHDFYWEKDDYRGPTCGLVRRLLSQYFPPKDPRILHVVINRLAQGELRRRGIESIVVPNVLDFEQGPRVDEFNQDFRDRCGLAPGDVVLLQSTRIVRRKGIELAVDLAALLSHPRFAEALRRRIRARGACGEPHPVLLLPNVVEDPPYLEQLQDRISRRGVDARFVSGHVAFKRAQYDDRKIYSLWDTYLFADVMTYPSLQEGWGNQFLEGVWAKLPPVVFEYPVFRTDIAPLGFRCVSLGKSLKRDADGLWRVPEPALRRAAEETAKLLSSPGQYQRVVEHNFFQLARRNLSVARLRELLGDMVTRSLAGSQGGLFVRPH
ncbi:TPA: glycosyl transferase family 1 [Candidatus Acetothermia bacterium]|nr:glycosyl transferase family 1 [Candidatus Acetothermia bacterium]